MKKIDLGVYRLYTGAIVVVTGIVTHELIVDDTMSTVDSMNIERVDFSEEEARILYRDVNKHSPMNQECVTVKAFTSLVLHNGNLVPMFEKLAGY